MARQKKNKNSEASYTHTLEQGQLLCDVIVPAKSTEHVLAQAYTKKGLCCLCECHDAGQYSTAHARGGLTKWRDIVAAATVADERLGVATGARTMTTIFGCCAVLPYVRRGSLTF